MSLEIAGSRFLAPHFGNSVFVWGSLITVFLTALSLGYWVGGIAADRGPSFRRLTGLCAVVGFLIGLIPWIGHPLCEKLVESGFAEQAGPMAATLILFLPPSFLLGMLSPYAIRLASKNVESVGRAAGRLYAVSTMGSIVGTLVTTFVLVPHMGVAWILKTNAAVMLGFAFTLVLVGWRRLAPAALVVVASSTLFLPYSVANKLQLGEKLVLETHTPYHDIRIADFPDQQARYLMFDDDLIQGNTATGSINHCSISRVQWSVHFWRSSCQYHRS